ALLGGAAAPPLGDRHAERVLGGLHGGVESFGRLVAADLSHALAEDRVKLHPVPVTVDDGMVEARPDLRRGQVPVRAHVLSSQGRVRKSYSYLRCASPASISDPQPSRVGTLCVEELDRL